MVEANPSALCLRFPALQACTEELPLVLQRPDSFPLVVGILQEFNHEKVGGPSGVDNTFIVLQRPLHQQMQTLGLTKVKLETSDLEENHQYMYDTSAELCQEWSLKGVEEMLADSEELQLRHGSYQQGDAVAVNPHSFSDMKLLFGLQSTQFEFKNVASDEAELLVDKKPPPCSELLKSFKERVPFQGREPLVEEQSEVERTLLDLHASISAQNKGHQQSSQACMENRMGLDALKVVKREHDENVLCGEEELQILCYLRQISTSMSTDAVLEGKETEGCIVSQQIKREINSNEDNELCYSQKTAGLTENIQVRKGLSCGSPESNLDIERKKQHIVHDIKRTTSAILALPANFTEQEENHMPKSPNSTSNPLTAEEPKNTEVCCGGGGGGTQGTDLPEAEFDVCELTLSLGSLQPQTSGLCSRNLECVEKKLVVKTSSVHSMPHGIQDGSSALDDKEGRFLSENDPVQPCQVSLQRAQTPEINGPHKKRMRGTLLIEEEGDGVQKEKDTRCHRSDGKSWRCSRECINGAYYCQYHLRARRIGYNRRKHGDTDTHHLESVSKKPSKVRKKSRQVLSITKGNSRV